ncbi:hypothetical protein NOCARDAX2BIS_160038 [Nocardioides sp. AX2bis]|nr:hypothetical protein NOCARDAX2BIS_160038 [Nocardioides sp. AX2bis]
MGRGAHRPLGTRVDDRLHLRRALPDVLGRARLGRAGADRLRQLDRPADRLAGRARRGPVPGRAAADQSGGAGPGGRGARPRSRRAGPCPARALPRPPLTPR